MFLMNTAPVYSSAITCSVSPSRLLPDRFSGPPGWNVAGESGDGHEEYSGGGKRQGVVGANLIEQSTEELRHAQSRPSTDGDAKDRQRQALADHAVHNRSRSGPERCAQA